MGKRFILLASILLMACAPKRMTVCQRYYDRESSQFRLYCAPGCYAPKDASKAAAATDSGFPMECR